MNPMIQGYHYHAMWWRLCGDIAQVNLSVLQKMSEAGSKQAQKAAMPMVAFGVYAAKSKRPVKAPVVVSSALDLAKNNAARIADDAAEPAQPCVAALRPISPSAEDHASAAN